jgi:uncharacterized Zn finger protein (UPF0148 family)
MSAKRLSIKSVSRRRLDGTEETLPFTSGVNVLVGEGNTGKTKWLETIDYLLGDEVSAEERDDPDNVLFSLFDSASLVLDISGEELIVERRWKEQGSLGKVYVNGDPESLRDYWHRLLQTLDIPVVHYPQGNPYGMRKWPELGWRTLFRHMYRRETMWSDLADQQPEIDQHASLMQFLGIAARLFSVDYGNLVSKNKRLWELQAQRDQFVSMLDQISKDLVDVEELGVALTPDSLAAAQARLKDEEANLANKRTHFLETLRAAADHQIGAGKDNVPDVTEVSEQLVELEAQSELLSGAIKRTAQRIDEIATMRQLLKEEVAKLTRAEEAGKILADLRVTHCPACDLPIDKPTSETACYVCGRPTSANPVPPSSTRRIQFEREQAQSELEEMAELIADLKKEFETQQGKQTKITSGAMRLRKMLQPIRQAAAAVLPPELFLLDAEYGRIQEKMQQLNRIQSILNQREDLAQNIQTIQQEIAEIEGTVDQRTSDVDFESASDLLRDGMNTYLNKIVKLNPNSWLGKPVTVRLAERSFRIKVGESNWKTKLGATQRLYFLFSYHYALMNLAHFDGTLFPSFIMLDFPASLEDRAAIADKENFILEPFVDLLRQPEMLGCQILAAGRSFQELKGVNLHEFNEVWV